MMYFYCKTKHKIDKMKKKGLPKFEEPMFVSPGPKWCLKRENEKKIDKKLDNSVNVPQL